MPKTKPTGATFKTLLALDAALARGTIPPLTPWWKEQLKRFYEHPTARTLVARVGRRGTKSHVSAKVALNELLNGAWHVPPGEVHRFVFVSVDKSEASQRLQLLESFLRTIGVGFATAGDEITLTDRPLAFKVCAAQVGAVSGYAAIGAALDEVSKWVDGDAEPTDEIATSVAAMTVQHKNARRLIVSSPWSLTDFHARQFDLGDTDAQLVCQAPTWVANPSVTEEDTRKAETNPGKWKREFAAIPGDTESSAFDPAHVLAAFDRYMPEQPIAGEAIAVIDPSHGRHDTFAIAIVGPDARGGLIVANVTGIPSPCDTIDAVATLDLICQRYGVRRIFADNGAVGGTEALIKAKGYTLEILTWSRPSKHEAGSWLQRMLAEQALTIIPHEGLRKQMLDQRAKLVAGNMLDYPTGGRDYVSALFVLGHAIAAGHVSVEALGQSDYLAGLVDNPEAVTALAAGFGGIRSDLPIMLRIAAEHEMAASLGPVLNTPEQRQAVQLDQAARAQIARLQAEHSKRAAQRADAWAAYERGHTDTDDDSDHAAE